jgi:hypothetical protein
MGSRVLAVTPRGKGRNCSRFRPPHPPPRSAPPEREVVSWCGVGPSKQAQPQVPYHAPRVAALHRRSKRARCGVALVGNPEEVDAVASSNRHHFGRRKSYKGKGRIGEIGVGVPSLRADRRTTTASVVCGYEVTLERMLACRQTGPRVGVGYRPLACAVNNLACHVQTARHEPANARSLFR